MKRSNYYVETEGILGEIWSQIKKEQHPHMREVLLKGYCILLSNKYWNETGRKRGIGKTE
ncbi:hypothetical protein F8154_10285 [Alkaliphilus pronyensis]|uniref:Uncharacterized protein n=1 Tax=Alkaliphilus pronyensis TaxID=1482732 RepID=A0A6I0EYJ5_9FIRM|nr:hypothetical protein [Alkaliphilus pronyensis]KAB3533847.1 hypothetical protein F8154_10285 [Alkaliphilus pronyensis]